jgi:NDP-sugar pyrophosphorylase family protein
MTIPSAPPSNLHHAGVAGDPTSDRTRVAAIVLAGSHAWRRQSIESFMPRPVLPVGNRPLIAHPLMWLAAGGIKDAIICTNGLSGLIRQHVTALTGLPALTYFDDETPRGPAGSAADAMARLEGGPLVIVEHSTIPELDLPRLVADHRASGAAATIVVQPRNLDGRGPSGSAVPVGIYVFERRALEGVPSLGYQDIKEMLLQRLHLAGEQVRIHAAEAWCYRVIDARSYLNVNHSVIDRACAGHAAAAAAVQQDGPPSHGASVIAHPTSRIEPGALVIGPVVLGAHSVLRRDSVVIGPTAIGRQTTVHRGAVVSRSVVWDRCDVSEGAFVNQSVVVSDICVPAGARLTEVVRVPSAPRYRGPSAGAATGMDHSRLARDEPAAGS